jgi:hypothetical protein
MYIAETAPSALRGMLVSLNNVMCVVGQVCARALAHVLRSSSRKPTRNGRRHAACNGRHAARGARGTLRLRALVLPARR